MKIGIFGGTFNPPHMGHVSAARAAVHALGLDILYFVPTNIPPHKSLPEGSATSAQRLEMTELAARMVDNACALDIELAREGPSYTVDTVRELAQASFGSELWLVVGTDMLMTFERWREPHEILRHVRLAAVYRGADERQIVAAKARELEQSLGAGVDIIDNTPVEVSSTSVRLGGMYAALPPEIEQYIVRHGLYGVHELGRLREAARQRLSDRRYNHTLGCEGTAAVLAEIYGESVLDARRAALLHDITKELPLSRQLQLCEEWRIIIDYQPHTIMELIHADTAAETAKRQFNMPPHVCDAVKYHSTGRAGMSRLEKIIYVADKIEPARTFADLPPIRETAGRDLDCAVREVLTQNIASLARRGIRPHRRTVEALEYISNREKPEQGKG